MKIEDVKIGMRVVFEGEGGMVKSLEGHSACEKVWVLWDDSGNLLWTRAEDIEPEEKPFPLANTKINVQKYADKNGITLKQAHKEIQPWLFEQGCDWSEGDKNILCTFAQWLNVGVLKSYPSTDITWSSSDYHTAKEITLSRNVTVELTPSFVGVGEPAVEYVELGGKRYVKSELEEALSKIKAVEE